jgi:hypothetical protein
MVDAAPLARALEGPVYLGDGLYCRFDGWYVVVYAWDGVQATNTVYLEPAVLISFEEYCRTLKTALKKLVAAGGQNAIEVKADGSADSGESGKPA